MKFDRHILNHYNRLLLQKRYLRIISVIKHMPRPGFAAYLLKNGYDIRTIKELSGHKNLQTTMVYTHVMNKGPMGVKSQADNLRFK